MILTKKLSRMVPVAATCLLVLSAGNLSANDDHDQDHSYGYDYSSAYQYPNVFNNHLQPVVTAIDYHTRMIYLFNYEDEQLIIIDPASIDGWPGDIPLQHTVIMPKGDIIYITPIIPKITLPILFH